VFIVSASGGQKPQFSANCNIFGSSCTDPLLPMRAKFGVLYQTHGIRLPAKFRLYRFILSSCGCGKPQFLPFFGLRHLVVSPSWQQSQKAEHKYTSTNLPLINGIKIVSVLPIFQHFQRQRLCARFRHEGEIGRTISDVEKRDEQTNEKTQRFWLPRRLVKSEPHQTWHDNRGPRASSCTSKTFGV